MTNQTIDGVPRPLAESIVRILQAAGAWDTAEQLRALMDAQLLGSNGILCQNSKCAECGGHGSYKAPALLDTPVPFPGYPPVPEARKLPAAQHPGEPVAWMVQSGSVIPGFQGHREVTLKDPGALDAAVTPLYAEQPPEPKP